MVLSRKQYTLAATALGSSLAFIDAAAVIVALPTIQQALHLGLAGEQWVFLAYSLALASLYLIGGSLGDKLGHKRIFIQGLFGFAIASALAGLATSGTWLITARVLQGIGGAFLTTNSLAWLRSVYADEAGKAVGLWTSLTSVSTVGAPLLGGALTQWLSWRWIFYINLPLSAIILLWAGRAMETEPDKNSSQRFDPLGSLLIGVGLGFLTYYLVQGAKHGFRQLWWSLLVGIVGLVGFLAAEAKQKQPMLPLKLFKIRNFSMSNLETLLIYGALNGIFVYLTLYLQFLGLSPLSSSLFLIPASISLILLASYFGSLADRIGPRGPLTAAPALIGTGALLFSTISSKNQIWSIGVLGTAVFAIGLAILVAPITTVALKSVPMRYAGIASGINNTVARIGGLIAIALSGMVISIVFFSHISDKAAVPLGLHQTDPVLLSASRQGYRAGMLLVVGLAWAAAAVGWLGLTNRATSKE